MGSLVKTGDKEKASGSTSPPAEGETSGLSKVASRTGISGMTSWAQPFIRPGGEGSAQRTRRKSTAEEAEEEDDRNIRFRIGGVGQRMTKEDFIAEMRKLDKTTRREVVDQSNASDAVKTLAKADAPASAARGKAVASEPVASEPVASEPVGTSRRSESSSDSTSVVTSNHRSSSGSPSPIRSPGIGGSRTAASRSLPETAVERRRRLAALRSTGDVDDEASETPAERRRREAALGMSAAGAEDDSDDDDTPRVPPARRGIRFADVPERGRR
jgi:hypothetical protein